MWVPFSLTLTISHYSAREVNGSITHVLVWHQKQGSGENGIVRHADCYLNVNDNIYMYMNLMISAAFFICSFLLATQHYDQWFSQLEPSSFASNNSPIIVLLSPLLQLSPNLQQQCAGNACLQCCWFEDNKYRHVYKACH